MAHKSARSFLPLKMLFGTHMFQKDNIVWVCPSPKADNSLRAYKRLAPRSSKLAPEPMRAHSNTNNKDNYICSTLKSRVGTQNRHRKNSEVLGFIAFSNFYCEFVL